MIQEHKIENPIVSQKRLESNYASLSDTNEPLCELDVNFTSNKLNIKNSRQTSTKCVSLFLTIFGKYLKGTKMGIKMKRIEIKLVYFDINIL